MSKAQPEAPRVRVAPSPTGPLHVGVARAALFNELFARQKGGAFVLRIEDTDRARSKQEYEEDILEGFRWLGLTWDEGPDKGGAYGPYRQSERTAAYRKAIEGLIDGGRAYHCYCPPAKKESQEIGTRCQCITPEGKGVEAESSHDTSIIRLFVEPQTVTFQDIIRGPVITHTDSFGGNFTIARSLNEPLYHLAVVVDDAAMKISHVIRGEDHLSNTAKHILLQRALGYPEPQYAHLPLLLDEKRAKLSKRSGETSLLKYRDVGILPEAMLNYLALLGWSPKDNREFFTHEELMQKFSLKGVQKSGAVFSLTKLMAINKHYLRQLSPSMLLEAAWPFLEEAGILIEDNSEQLKKALALEQERVATLAELPQAIEFFLPGWKADFEPALLVWKKSDQQQTGELLKKLIAQLETLGKEKFTEERLKDYLMAWIGKEQLDRGSMLWPMRVALTGREHSPGPFEVAAVLGKEATLNRLHHALQLLRTHPKNA